MALNLTVPSGTFHLSGNPIWIKISGASAPSGSTNYQVLCKVTSIDGLLIGGPFIDPKAPFSGEAWFDVSEYCKQPADQEFEWPLSGGLNPYNDLTREVKFTPGEWYIDENGDEQESWGSDSDTHYVVNGGLGNSRLGAYNDQSSSFYADYVLGKKFLTHQPDFQVVAPFQPVKLWFLADADYNADLKIKGYYDDASTYTYSNSHGFYENIMHEINCMPRHADSVNLAPVKSGNVKMTHYEVWIEGKTAKRTFVLDHSYYERCNYLFVLNSLGGVDVIWLNGEITKGFPSSDTRAVRPFPREGSALTPTTIVSDRSATNTWKINSGYKSEAQILALREASLTRQAWLLEDASGYNEGTLSPVIAEPIGGELLNSMEDLHAIDLDITEAHNNQYL